MGYDLAVIDSGAAAFSSAIAARRRNSFPGIRTEAGPVDLAVGTGTRPNRSNLSAMHTPCWAIVQSAESPRIASHPSSARPIRRDAPKVATSAYRRSAEGQPMSTTNRSRCWARSRSTASRAKGCWWMSRPMTSTGWLGRKGGSADRAGEIRHTDCTSNAAAAGSAGSTAAAANGPHGVVPAAILGSASRRTTVYRPRALVRQSDAPGCRSKVSTSSASLVSQPGAEL
jgi:hypothetical protein